MMIGYLKCGFGHQKKDVTEPTCLTYICRLVDGTSMNEEYIADDAVGSMPKLQPQVDRQVCAMRFLTWEDVAPRRPTSPTKHNQNPMAGKIRDDWWVQPSHGEGCGSAKRG